MKAVQFMDRNEVFQRVAEILRESVDDAGLDVCDETSRDDLAAWDSLGHIRILTAVEESFEVRFDLDEVPLLSDVGKIVDRILQKR